MWTLAPDLEEDITDLAYKKICVGSYGKLLI